LNDNRDRRGRTFGSQGRLRHLRNDDVDLELHQLCRKIGKSIELPFREPILDGDVFSFDVAELAQPLPECLISLA
jgi:hypothetical protein